MKFETSNPDRLIIARINVLLGCVRVVWDREQYEPSTLRGKTGVA